jgi:hypothetical protein
MYTGMPSEQFERRLRQRLEGAELAPRPEAWEGLRARLASQRRRRRFAFFWLPDLMAGALLLFAASPPPQAAPASLAAAIHALPSPDSCAPAALVPPAARNEARPRSLPPALPLAAAPQPRLPEASPGPAALPPQLPAMPSRAVLGAAAPETPSRRAAAALGSLPLRPFTLSAGPEILPLRAGGPTLAHQRLSWSLYLRREGFAPTAYAYGRVEANLSPLISSQYPGAVYSFELPRGQTAGGLRLGWDLRPWLRLQGGLGLALSDTGRVWKGLLASVPVAGDEFDGGLPPFYAQASSPEMLRFRELRAELPLRLQARLPLGPRQHLFASFGLEGQYRLLLLRDRFPFSLNEEDGIPDRSLDFSGNAIQNPTNQALLTFRRAGLRLWGGLGYEYRLSPRMALFASPGLHYDARRLYGGPAAAEMPRFRLSAETGLTFYW